LLFGFDLREQFDGIVDVSPVNSEFGVGDGQSHFFGGVREFFYGFLTKRDRIEREIVMN
jgi:hypothetical protein